MPTTSRFARLLASLVMDVTGNAFIPRRYSRACEKTRKGREQRMNRQLQSRRLAVARTLLAVTAAAWGLRALASNPRAQRFDALTLVEPEGGRPA